MIFLSIKITEGMYTKKFDFSDKVNLIHSNQNSRGKTTLIRFLLYSLGFSIPNTKKIKFQCCEVEVNIKSEYSGKLTLLRNSSDYIIVTKKEERNTFVLPEQLTELHKLIFGTDNLNILNNLLGAFYLDQEKGWTLLNRGVVIGSNRFNIEELIRGLSGVDCKDQISQLERLLREFGKYQQMFSVAKLREKIEQDSDLLVVDNYVESVDKELTILQLDEDRLKKELRRLDRVLKDNNRFLKFVSEMKLLIKTPEGEEIPVTENNLVGFNDNIEYLVAKHKMVSSELSNVLDQISKIESNKSTEDEQLSFWESENLSQVFDKRLLSMKINSQAIKHEMQLIENQIKQLREKISTVTRNNDVIPSLYKKILKYATELGIGDKSTITESYLFTSNLKELSGALLHKTVFAFRLAYISEIEDKLRIKLPIILDSPSGKEIDKDNVQKMIDILKRDFLDNQIIIASIFKYSFDVVNEIEIINHLIETDGVMVN